MRDNLGLGRLLKVWLQQKLLAPVHFLDFSAVKCFSWLLWQLRSAGKYANKKSRQVYAGNEAQYATDRAVGHGITCRAAL